MYLFLNLTIKDQSVSAKKNKLVDDECRAIDANLIRGNVLEDLLVQMRLQLSCLEECFTVWVLQRDIVPQVKSLGSEILQEISRVSAVMCHYVNHYFGEHLIATIVTRLTLVKLPVTRHWVLPRQRTINTSWTHNAI